MPVSVSRDSVKAPHGTMRYNVLVDGLWYPLQIKTDMPVFTDDDRPNGQEVRIDYLGTPQAEPFDFSDITGLRAFRTALPATIPMKVAFTALVISAINEDPSV